MREIATALKILCCGIVFAAAIATPLSEVIYMSEDTPHKLLGFPFPAVEYAPHQCPFLNRAQIKINFCNLFFNLLIIGTISALIFYPQKQPTNQSESRLQAIIVLFLLLVTMTDLIWAMQPSFTFNRVLAVAWGFSGVYGIIRCLRYFYRRTVLNRRKQA